MKIEATVKDGTLTLNVGDHGATVRPATDAKACDVAINHLLEMLAGVTKHELTMAAYRAVEGANA